MKAIVWTNYGPPGVLELREIEKPTPRDKEVRIKVDAATVTAGDCEVRNLKLPLLYNIAFRLGLGIRKPERITILGQELAGEIEAVGKDVTRFSVGDHVFAPTFFRFGAYAEYACLNENYPVLKPANMTYQEAATLPTGGINALHYVTTANLQPGQRVVINGAGGSIGTYAVQIAKAFGAEVTAVDSTEKLAMLRSIGADHVIDYTKVDFTKQGETYDAIIDLVGKSSFLRGVRSLKSDGRYVLVSPSRLRRILGNWISRGTGKKFIFKQTTYRAEDYALLIGLMESGKVKPIIDRCYPLEQMVEAHQYVGSGHKQGHVVIAVAHDR